MTLKLLPIAAAVGLLSLTTFSARAAEDSDVSALIQKINARTEQLEDQIKALKAQVQNLKQQKSIPSTTNKTSKGQEKAAFAPSVVGRPVVTSPYIGHRSAFDGSDLVVNVSSINEDLRLLEQRQKIENTARAQGGTEHFPVLELSGLVEAQALYNKNYSGLSTTDIDLTGAEIDSVAYLQQWVTGFITFNYDNGAGTKSQRTTNSNLFVNKAFITVGDLNHSGFYGTVGQFVVPFGRYSSAQVSSPLTQSVFRIKDRALLLGYKQPGDTGFYGSGYIYRGSTDLADSTGKVNKWGANLGYAFKSDELSGKLGASYVNNIADSDGMQAVGSEEKDKNETLEHRVPGAGIRGKLTYKPFTAVAEYLTATKNFDALDLSFGDAGAKPSALQLEGIYAFNLMERPGSLAVAYGQTKDALALHLPEKRYSITLNSNLFENTLAALEFRHDIDYGSNDRAFGKGATNTEGSGKSSNRITAYFAIYW